MKNILVATDGSSHAGKAVELAGSLASQYGAKLHIVHVLMHGRPPEELERMAEVEGLVRRAGEKAMPDIDNFPATMTGVFREVQRAEDQVRLITAIGDEILDHAADVAREAGAKEVTTEALDGDYASEVLGAAKRIGADTIVTGSRGLGDLKGLLVGSVSHKITQHADCTVITVK